MKKSNLFLLLFLTVFAFSCGDDDCESTDINGIILGTWSYNGFDITFNADGSLDDPSNVFEGSINNIELSEDRYELEGDSILTITTFSTDPPLSLSTDHDIDSYDCNEMELTAFVTVTMKKQ